MKPYRRAMVAVVVAFLTTAAVSAQSQSWNAASDFSLVTNPNGAWSYGSKGSPTSVL